MTDSVSLEHKELVLSNMTCDLCVERVRRALETLPGVENVDVSIGRAKVVYYPEVTRPAILLECVAEIGYPVLPSPRDKKGVFGRWLDRLIESNKQSFGSQALDCCKLNRQDGPGKAS